MSDAANAAQQAGSRPSMHPRLTLENNPGCVEQILAFQRCHEENGYFTKLFGGCNEPKNLLDKCLRKNDAKLSKRKANLEKARAERARWQQTIAEERAADEAARAST